MDTGKEAAFERITSVARKAFDVPVAAVNFIAGDRVWFKSCDGFDVREIPR